MKWISNSPEETEKMGQKILRQFPEIQFLCLRGPLGSGKTSFVKGIGMALGIEKSQIKSPTFTTLLEHDGKKKLQHLDFYRLECANDLPLDWWQELIDNAETITVAEWGDRITPHLPNERLDIEFIDAGGDQRHLIITLIQ